MKNPIRFVAVLTCLAALSGCFSNASRPGGEFNKVPPGGAQTVAYEGSFDAVWDATLKVMTALQASDHMNIKKQDKSQGLIYAKKPMTMVSTGENVTVRIKAIDGTKCSVEIVTRRVVQTKGWTAMIHQSLSAVLRRVGD